MEDHNHETCQGRYESLREQMGDQLRSLKWLLGIMTTLGIVAVGFMVKSSVVSSQVQAGQALAEKEREILALDIERAKVEWGKSLTVAVDKIAQENRFKTQEIMYKLQSIEEKLSVKESIQ